MKSRHSNVPRRKTILVILDGVGVNPSKRFNAVHEADTPNFDRYFGQYPHTTLNASGRSVGLPDGQMGNSEVGHMTIGCGSILRQDLVRIEDAIDDRSFFKNHSLLNAMMSSCDLPLSHSPLSTHTTLPLCNDIPPLERK